MTASRSPPVLYRGTLAWCPGGAGRQASCSSPTPRRASPARRSIPERTSQASRATGLPRSRPRSVRHCCRAGSTLGPCSASARSAARRRWRARWRRRWLSRHNMPTTASNSAGRSASSRRCSSNWPCSPRRRRRPRSRSTAPLQRSQPRGPRRISRSPPPRSAPAKPPARSPRSPIRCMAPSASPMSTACTS